VRLCVEGFPEPIPENYSNFEYWEAAALADKALSDLPPADNRPSIHLLITGKSACAQQVFFNSFFHLSETDVGHETGAGTARAPGSR
jgi:hypothetical protein